MDRYTTEIIDAIETPNDEWVAFLDSLENADARQYPFWVKAKKAIGYLGGKLLLIRENGVLVGGAQILLKSYSALGNIGVIIQGPYLVNDSSKLAFFFAREAKRFTRKHRLLYLIVELPYHYDYLSRIFKRKLFHKKPNNLPGGYFYPATWAIDLTKDEDKILAGFSKARRRDIRNGAHLNINYREAELEDAELCHKLFMCNAVKYGGFVPETDLRFIESLLSTPKEYRRMKMLIGEVNGEDVSAQLYLTSGKTFMFYLWGWNGMYEDDKYAVTVDWDFMRWAKKNGFTTYDLVEVDKRVATAVLEGQPIDDKLKQRTLFGASFYKTRFGGTMVESPGILAYYPTVFHKIIFHRFVSWFIGSNFKVWLSKIKRKIVKPKYVR